MIPSTIIARARRLSSTAGKYYTDQDGLDDLNQVKNNLWSTIVTYVNENMYWQEFTTTPVVWQSEYTLPPITSSTTGAKKLKDIKIAYQSTPYTGTSLLQYVVAKEISPSTLPFPWSYYVQFQNPLTPIYYVADNSYFIAPAPTVAVANGIVITGIRNIPDYTNSTTEDQMIIPLDQQELLVYGLVPYIYDMKTMATESQLSTQKYEQMKQNMIANLSERVIAPFQNQFPDDLANQSLGNNNFILTL